jgi:hypothetical protein
MQWRHDNDMRLAEVSGGAGAILAAAEAAIMLGVWDAPRCVFRAKGADGRAVWLWHPPGGESLLCAAVAPWGDVWDCDQVDGRDFFGRQPPETWVTKARLGRVAKDWSSRPAIVWNDATAWAVGLFRVDGKPNARRAQLYRVARVEGGALREVCVEDGAPCVPIENLGATRWIPQDAHMAGYQRMWDAGDTESGSYMWHVIKAARLAGNSLTKKAKSHKSDS